ncbi:MAG: cupredoxin domain-containing protein [Sphingomicrobium sp.]
MHSFRFLGAALLIALSAPAAAQPASYVVQVYSFGFTPRPIHLAAGRPVTLTFVNSSGNGHDFTAKSFFASARIITGAAPGGEIELRGGETRRITLIPRAGVYKAHCSHFLHATMGMTDQIIVN